MSVKSSESKNGLPPGRASQRVLDHLAALRSGLKPGETLRIPPVRQLAKELKVSKATIYHAFKQFSSSGGLTTAVGRGSFLRGAGKKLNVGLSWTMSYPQPFSRIAAITHAILHASMDPAHRVDIRPLPIEALQSERKKEFIIEEADELDAMILSASATAFLKLRDRICEVYESKGKPVVLLDAPELNATKNFVAPDVFGTTREIGYVWARTGRKRIAFLMRESVNATVTTLHALIGLKSGIAHGGNQHQRVEQILADAVTEQDGYDAMKKYLETHAEAPDAIYCFGDVLAWGCFMALQEKGLKVPEDVSLIGGTGFSANLPVIGKFSAGNLTRVNYSFDAIARELIKMVIARAGNKGAPMPGIYIPGTMMRGLSTRPEENELFPFKDTPVNHDDAHL